MNEILDISWFLIYAGLALVLIELFVGIETGFDLVLIGTTLIIGGGVGNLVNSWVIGLAATAILAFGYVVFGRSFIKSKLVAGTHASNAEAIIGQIGLALTEIGPQKTGQVKVANEVWRASSEQEINQSDKVKVEKIEGVTVFVIKSE